MGKSPSYSKASPEPYRESEIPRSKSQNLVRDPSRGRFLLKPIVSPRNSDLSMEVIERIYREKCKDMGIQLIPEQLGRFADFCVRNVRKRKFVMEECGLGTEAAKVIAEVIRFGLDFVYICVGQNPLHDSGAITVVKAIAKANHIVHLGLNSTDLSPEGSQELLSYLEPHKSITSLDLSSSEGLYRNRMCGPGSLAIASLLRTNPILSVLNLSGTFLGPEGGEALSTGLSSNSSLLWLDLSRNHLSGRVWEPLCRSLSTSKLQYLRISDNPLKPTGTESLSKLLSGQFGLCPLVSLVADRCEITAGCVTALWGGLGRNPGLRVVSLQENNMGEEAVTEMYQFLAENSGVKELSLSGCRLKGDAVLTLADGLAKNQALTSLNLSHNCCEDQGAIALSDSLSRNTALKHLDLSSNRICQAGGAALCLSLASNRSLEAVILSDNSINDEGGRILAEISVRNKSLTKVGLQFNPVSMRFVREIERNIEANRAKKVKSVTPALKNEIKLLKVPKNAFEEIDKDREAKVREQKTLEGQLETHRERQQYVQEEENSKFAQLQAELESVKQTKLSKAIELREVQTLLKVIVPSGRVYKEHRRVLHTGKHLF